MLQALRNRIHGWPATIVLGLATLAMSLFGIQNYMVSRNETWVAKVGKHEITQQDFQNRLNQLRQRAIAQYGDQFDASVYEQPAMKQRILDSMIDQQLLQQANDQLGLVVSDDALRDTIASIPAFQANGQFDPTTYRAELAAQGKTPAMFENELRSELGVGLIPDAITASALVTSGEVDRYLALRLQQRDIRYVALPAPTLGEAESKVTDAQVQAYYKQHASEFTAPEQVQLAYVEVDGKDLAAGAPPSEDDLRQRYEQEKQQFVKPEQREVSHILIDVPKNATPAQQKAALAKARKIAAEATPQNFARLARQYSEDLGSKRLGGDLGWLERGVTEKAFEDALFSMQKGQISKPVLSDEGYHILWLRGIRKGDVKPFAEVRDQIAKEAAQAQRKSRYNEVAGKLADEAYQNPSTLEPAAQAAGQPIQHTGLFGRDGGQGLAADPKVIKAAFSDDVLGQGNNSNLIKLGDDRSVVVRVEKHQAAKVRPLAEVHDRIVKDLLAARVEAAGRKQADALLARLRKGEDLAKVAADAGAEVKQAANLQREGGDVPPPVGTAAFLMPHPQPGKPQFADADLQGGSYALIALDKVHDGDLSKVTAEQRKMLRQSMLKAYGTAETQAFVDLMRAQVEVKKATDRL